MCCDKNGIEFSRNFCNGPENGTTKLVRWGRFDMETSIFFLIYFLFYIGVELTYIVVLVSGVEQNDSVIHIHIATLF